MICDGSGTDDPYALNCSNFYGSKGHLLSLSQGEGIEAAIGQQQIMMTMVLRNW